MKCVFGNDYIIVYIQNSNINEECLEDLETYFKEIFSKIREIYQINMNGFYLVKVYIDSIYGVIREIEEEKLEYIEYYDDAVDMKISLHREEFLYKIKDISKVEDINNIDIYSYNNEWYIKIKNNKCLYQILEFTEIIYKDTKKIIKYGKKI